MEELKEGQYVNALIEKEKPKYEMVNHPKHYHPGTYEAINVIEAW